MFTGSIPPVEPRLGCSRQRTGARSSGSWSHPTAAFMSFRTFRKTYTCQAKTVETIRRHNLRVVPPKSYFRVWIAILLNRVRARSRSLRVSASPRFAAYRGARGEPCGKQTGRTEEARSPVRRGGCSAADASLAPLCFPPTVACLFRRLRLRCIRDAVRSFRLPSMLPLSNAVSGLLERLASPLRCCVFPVYRPRFDV